MKKLQERLVSQERGHVARLTGESSELPILHSMIHARLVLLGNQGAGWFTKTAPELSSVPGVRWVEDDVTTPDVAVVAGTSDAAKAVVAQRRAVGDSTPIVVVNLTVNDESSAFILEAGADDCLPRSDDICELWARVRAVVRRSRGVLSCASEIAADRRTLRVRVGDVEACVSHRLFELFVYLAERRERWVHTDEILAATSGTHHSPESSIVRVQIHSLRKALGTAGAHIHADGHRSYMLSVAPTFTKARR